MAEYSASLYAKNATEYSSYLEYYRDYYKKKEEEDQVTKLKLRPNYFTYGLPFHSKHLQAISKTKVAPVSCSSEVKNGQIPANNRLDLTASV